MFDTLLLRPSLHCNTPLHFTTLHPTTLHHTSPNYTSLHFTTLHHTSPNYTSLHFATLHHTSPNYTLLHFTTLRPTTLHYTSLHFTKLHFTACGRSPPEIVGSNPTGPWIFVCCECRVLSGRGLCDELITRREESYRLWCVDVCDLETLRIGAPYIYIYMTLVA